MDIKIPVDGLVFQPELSTTQVPIALGAGGLFAAANNIATITFNAAHGLTLNPVAGTMPNYFVTFNGVTGQTGVGTLNGPVFPILAIPSATTILLWTTITAAVMTAANCVPIFICPFTPQNVSAMAGGGPTQTIAGTVTPFPPPNNYAALVSINAGNNCAPIYNPDNTSVIQLPGQPTLATTPVYRSLGPPAASQQVWFSGAAICLSVQA